MKNHLQDFKRFSVNENRFGWDPDQDQYTFDYKAIDAPYGHCFGCFAYGRLELYTFDVTEAADWLADALAEGFSSGSGSPSEDDYMNLIVRGMDLNELLDEIGEAEFMVFLKANQGKWG